MQSVETLNEGLKRAYTLTIPAKDIAAKVDAEIKAAAPNIRMPGFRPGKVPANLIRKMHGPAMEREALNTAVQEGVQALLGEKALRPAMQPSVELDEDYAPGKDVEVKVALEVLPAVPTPAIDGLTLERLTVEPDTGRSRRADPALRFAAEGVRRRRPGSSGGRGRSGRRRFRRQDRRRRRLPGRHRRGHGGRAGRGPPDSWL